MRWRIGLAGRLRSRTIHAAYVGGALAMLSLAFTPSAQAVTFAVTNNSDSGPGSLREAILDATATIIINSGIGTIALTSVALPRFV